ncbi:MAG: hypothetical protein AB8G11_22410 [Saprospiraceae bacterium]
MGNHLMIPAQGDAATIGALASGNQLKVGHVYGNTDSNTLQYASAAGTLESPMMTKFGVSASAGTAFDVNHADSIEFEDRGLVKAVITGGKVGFEFDATGQDGKVLVVSSGSVGYGDALVAASFDDSDTIDFSVTDGVATASVKVSATAGNSIRKYSDGIYSKQLTVHADSANFLEIDDDGKIVYKPLARINQFTATEDTLALWIAANYTAGTEAQESDVVHIPTSGKSYQHNGGSAGDATDFTLIETPGIEDSAIRAKFSGGNGIDYTTATGVIAVKLDPTDNDATLSAAGLKVDVSAGAVTDTNTFGATTVQTMFDEITDDLKNEVTYKAVDETITGNWEFDGTADFDAGVKFNSTVAVESGGSFLLNTGSTATAKANIVWDATFGPVIKSPDGSDWRLAINNDGSMSPVKL